MNQLKLRKQLQYFLMEDIGDRDITSETVFPAGQQGEGMFLAKEAGILAGVDIITAVYHLIDPNIVVHLAKLDKEKLKRGDVIATASGNVRNLLTGERVILNLMQRMSGIATLTNAAVTRLDSPVTKICDTRKTTPGLRMFEKYAVTCGGAFNHRFGLYDGVMIKDNHISFSGSITKAVEAVRSQLGHMVKIEVETENEQQVREAVKAKADIIMFDNRSPQEVKKFVKLVPDTIVTEASGNITLETLVQYRDTGVDYISMGFLTHSARALDISFNVEYKGENK